MHFSFSSKYNDKSVITVNRNGTPTVSSLEEIQNDHVYKGEENELILSQVYTTDFICEYNLRNYPFDVQKCSMIFLMQVSLHKLHKVMLICYSIEMSQFHFSGEQWELRQAPQK